MAWMAIHSGQLTFTAAKILSTRQNTPHLPLLIMQGRSRGHGRGQPQQDVPIEDNGTLQTVFQVDAYGM